MSESWAGVEASAERVTLVETFAGFHVMAGRVAFPGMPQRRHEAEMHVYLVGGQGFYIEWVLRGRSAVDGTHWYWSMKRVPADLEKKEGRLLRSDELRRQITLDEGVAPTRAEAIERICNLAFWRMFVL